MTRADAATTRATAPRCVVVADSELDTRAFLASELRALDCEVFETSDGRQALANALTLHPALVVTDATLLFIDGYELSTLLRSDYLTHVIPIMIWADEPDVGRARNAGANAILSKSAPPDEVRAELRRLLRLSHELRILEAARTDPGPEQQPETVGPKPSESRKTLVGQHPRFFTDAPPKPPPELRCPECDSILQYNRSYVGGVSGRDPEQWDYYTCRHGGSYQYRQRTRKLRPAS